MLAPLGPLSAEALTFTLVKPLGGPCTITWVSTVSPRAPDKVMEEVAPGASVCPTLTRLGDTHTGNAGLDNCLAAMKIARSTSTPTANDTRFAYRKVPRARASPRVAELKSIFISLF